MKKIIYFLLVIPFVVIALLVRIFGGSGSGQPNLIGQVSAQVEGEECCATPSPIVVDCGCGCGACCSWCGDR